MTSRMLALVAAIALLLAGCAGFFPWSQREDFIRVRGGHFISDGKPYYFAGTNLWYGCYIGSPGETGDRDRLRKELDSLCANGMENLRILAASEQSYLIRSLRPAIQRAPGNLNDSLLEGLDYLLSEMGKRHMHAVLFLNNYWQWSGGMAQYNVWADGMAGAADPDDTTQGYLKFMVFSGTFYHNEKANALFRDFVRNIVYRRNTITGRKYCDDPTIMAWQLANEPRPGTSGPDGEANLDAFYRWIDQTAAYLHMLDTNHLVSTGSEGAVGFRWSTDYAYRTHQSKYIDYITFHIWPKNWSWFDPNNFEETLGPSKEKALDYMASHIAVARRLNKPLVLEEFGMARDSAKCAPESPTTARDRYFRTLLGALEDSARAGAPIAGSNFWGWGGLARGRNADDVWRKGDPFLGDPPQEPQGYNSVFVTDTSTVRILREHAEHLRAISESATALAIEHP
ncbi:MAG TPA: mannanase [Bacteroidota bacterium]|nr:mannanase [Bacteroidota bacterium]